MQTLGCGAWAMAIRLFWKDLFFQLWKWTKKRERQTNKQTTSMVKKHPSWYWLPGVMVTSSCFPKALRTTVREDKLLVRDSWTSLPWMVNIWGGAELNNGTLTGHCWTVMGALSISWWFNTKWSLLYCATSMTMHVLKVRIQIMNQDVITRTLPATFLVTLGKAICPCGCHHIKCKGVTPT